MKIVIDIREDIKALIDEYGTSEYVCEILWQAVKNGVPLPKGHGDLIDVNRKITVPVYDEQYGEWGENILTVREALNKWSDEGITVKDVVVLADKEQKDNGFFDEIMNESEEDEETYEKIKEIIEKVKENKKNGEGNTN